MSLVASIEFPFVTSGKKKKKEEGGHGSAQIGWDGDACAAAAWEAGGARDALGPGQSDTLVAEMGVTTAGEGRVIPAGCAQHTQATVLCS